MEANVYVPKIEESISFEKLILMSQSVKRACEVPINLYRQSINLLKKSKKDFAKRFLDDVAKSFRVMIKNEFEEDKNNPDIAEYNKAIRLASLSTKEGFIEMLHKDHTLRDQVLDSFWFQVQLEMLKSYIKRTDKTFEGAAKVLSYVVREKLIGCHKGSVWAVYYDPNYNGGKGEYFIVPYAWLEDEESKPPKLYLDKNLNVFHATDYGLIKDVIHRTIYEEEIKKLEGYKPLTIEEKIARHWQKDRRIKRDLDKKASKTTKHYNGAVFTLKDEEFKLITNPKRALLEAKLDGEDITHRKKCIAVQLINKPEGFVKEHFEILKRPTELFFKMCYGLS